MKKLTFLLLFVCAAAMTYAEQISKSQAAAIAGKYLPSVKNTRVEPLKKAVAVNQDAPEYYIFNAENGQGFVIISGDDELTEVVGYSATGTFKVSDEMPTSLKNYLTDYSNYVKSVREKKVSPIKRAVTPKTSTVVEPMIKSHWDQGAPYNKYTPYDKTYKVNCPTGCVATAMAQMMYYYKWPEKGTGSKSYVSNQMGNYGTIATNFSNSTYDWANMIDNYTSYREPNGTIVPEYTETQGDAVAKLMFDCGVAVSMQYGYYASGANDIDIVEGAAKYLFYDVDILFRNGTFKNQFLEKIISVLDSKNPVLFCGDGTGGGHAFVADGYDSNQFLHINWGWSGISDGFFSINSMNPDDLGTGGGAGGFIQHQTMTTFKPNKSGNAGVAGQIPALLLDYDYEDNGYFKTEATTFNKGDQFIVRANNFWNYSPSMKSWSLTAAIFDVDGNRFGMAGKEVQVTGVRPYYATGEYSFDLTDAAGKLADGNYLIKLLCKEVRAGMIFDWTYVVTPQVIALTVKDNQISIGGLPQRIEILEGIKSDKPQYMQGETANFTIKLANLSEVISRGTLKFLISDAATNAKKKTVGQSFSISGNSELVLPFSIDITPSPFAIGNNYKISVYSYSNTGTGKHTMTIPGDEMACVIGIVEDDGGVEGITADAVKVYPNPATDIIKVDADGISAIELYNAGGSLVKKVVSANEIAVSDCAAGYYLLNIITDSGSIRKPVIIK